MALVEVLLETVVALEVPTLSDSYCRSARGLILSDSPVRLEWDTIVTQHAVSDSGADELDDAVEMRPTG